MRHLVFVEFESVIGSLSDSGRWQFSPFFTGMWWVTAHGENLVSSPVISQPPHVVGKVGNVSHTFLFRVFPLGRLSHFLRFAILSFYWSTRGVYYPGDRDPWKPVLCTSCPLQHFSYCLTLRLQVESFDGLEKTPEIRTFPPVEALVSVLGRAHGSPFSPLSTLAVASCSSWRLGDYDLRPGLSLFSRVTQSSE